MDRGSIYPVDRAPLLKIGSYRVYGFQILAYATLISVFRSGPLRPAAGWSGH